MAPGTLRDSGTLTARLPTGSFPERLNQFYRDEGGVEKVSALIKGHLSGGTQINMNVMDTARVLEAHKDPSKYPDLVVRVTGFGAYSASLSPESRQLVVNRIITEGEGT